MWKLNNTQLNNEWVKEKNIKRKIKNYLETSEYENTIY